MSVRIPVPPGGGRDRLLDELRELGISDPLVLDAIRRVPRNEFVDAAFQREAWRNRSLPIGHQQTISQPWVVAVMSEVICRGRRPRKVLEIGTGSGYQTAVLAELVEVVFSVERIRSLSETARSRLARLGYRNIHFGYTDGSIGWAPYAPYDSIVVTAASETIPAALEAQLAPGGRMVIPVGPSGAQQLILVSHDGSGQPTRQVLTDVSFVPLVEGRA